MARIIVLRLHPDKPVTGAEFQAYLNGLRIEAFDASFDDPGGATAIGSTPDAPSKSTIVQHEAVAPNPPKAVASAMIVLKEPAPPEYAEPDILLLVSRAGKTVLKLAVEYNVAVHVVADQNVAAFDPTSIDPATVAAYVELPDPDLALNPNDAVVDLSKDGTPPDFATLKLATMKVLIAEKELDLWQMDANGNVLPVGPVDDAVRELTQKLASLTIAQCRHIAHEIAWNRHIDPIPSASKESFENMYTLTAANVPLSSEDSNTQKQFQGTLAQYHATHDADAEALTKYVFALSAAVACETKSMAAARAGLSFPIQPGVSPTGKVQDGEVVLEN